MAKDSQRSVRISSTAKSTKKQPSKPNLKSQCSKSALSKVASAPTTSASSVTKSSCSVKAQDPAKCQSRIKELIDKCEEKNCELEKREGDLFQRVQILEYSVPATMVWQACRARGSASSPEALREVVDKQFADAAQGYSCRVTPSRHYDKRVRDIEAQRKEAFRRAEEANLLWLEREAALQSQKARVELARQQQEERKQRMEKLAAEARKLEEEACKGPESGEGAGRTKWLELVESAASLHSCDLECLGRLESLAQAESCMKRRIAELEAKETAYMQALAQADELCRASAAKDSQNAEDESTKLRAELTEIRKQLEDCCKELKRYQQIEKSDMNVQASPALVDKFAQGEASSKRNVCAGRDGDLAVVRNQGCGAERTKCENKERKSRRKEDGEKKYLLICKEENIVNEKYLKNYY